MQHPQPDRRMTLAEFRVWHEHRPAVWEFIDGVPKLMAPGSKAHTVIKSNLGRVLGNALDQTGSRVLVDGAIVEVRGSSLIPDLVVTYAPLDFSTPCVAEPLIIVEILPPSNERHDTGRKLTLYLEVPSLMHYLVVHQDRRQIVHHRSRRGLSDQCRSSRPAAPPSTRHRDPARRALREPAPDLMRSR
jgi:Uma2 family endonuclease